MISKAEKTTAFIIETVAPIFNKNGYAATSLTDITKATNLTKGAIYGNFENKEELAAEAFRYIVNKSLRKLNEHLAKGQSNLDRLFLIVSFYRNYYQLVEEAGGCPFLNIGIDTNNQNSYLFKIISRKMESIIEKFTLLLELCKNDGVINDIDSTKYAKRFFSMIEGGVFMSFTFKDEAYLTDTMDVIENMIKQEILR